MLITQHIIGLELLMENAKLKMQELQDARTTNFNAYASVRGNYAQHFGRNTALRYPLVNMSISIVSSTLLEGRNFRKQLFSGICQKIQLNILE